MLPRKYASYQTGYEFRRINADRDIVPEYESADETVGFNGNGATNLLRKFVNHSLYNEKLVEDTLLNELNSIMAPESHFQSIRVQQIEVQDEIKWEIYLEEDTGERFALSKSGRGLKTIILMLINLYILPETKKYKGKEIVFAFEELENNLHPALQRKVFEYIPAAALQDKYGVILPELGPYDIFPEYISAQCKNFSTQKVPFAKSIVGHITTANSESILDLKKQIEKLYQIICRWNQ